MSARALFLPERDELTKSVFFFAFRPHRSDTGADVAIPLPNVSGKDLKKVIDYCEFKANSKKKDANGVVKSEEDIKNWENEFVKVDQGTLFQLILAANYLNIKELLDLTCFTVASMIRGKSPEEIRKAFNIKNDFTPSEEEQVRKENEWCEEK